MRNYRFDRKKRSQNGVKSTPRRIYISRKPKKRCAARESRYKNRSDFVERSSHKDENAPVQKEEA